MRLSKVLFAFFLACAITSCGSLRRIGYENGHEWVTYSFRTAGDTVYDVQLSKYNTKKNHGTVDNNTRLLKADDVANVKWGGNWR